MNKSLRNLIVFSVFVFMLIASALPLMAQTDEELEGAVCFRYSVTTSTGEYIYLYLGPQEIQDLINGGIIPNLDIQYTLPGSVLSETLILLPESVLAVLTPDGAVLALVWGPDALLALADGTGSYSVEDMDRVCRNDGRLNAYDRHMLAVIYRNNVGGYNIWQIDAGTSEGQFDYFVTRVQIDEALALANSTGQPQVISSGATSTLYALINGECQLNSPTAQGVMQEYTFDCAIIQ